MSAEIAVAASIIAEERALGRLDETIAQVLASVRAPLPPGFKGWTGYAVRTVAGDA